MQFRILKLVLWLYFCICHQFCSVPGTLINSEVLQAETISCDIVPCAEDSGTICSYGQCIPDPCKDVNCGTEEQCFLQDVDCFTFPCYPIAECRPISVDPCASVKCNGTVCINGNCVANCTNVSCPEGQECVIKVNPCLIAPCPTFPTCVPIDSCANVFCGEGTICIEGECYPNTSLTCENISCDVGEECFYETVVCIQAPCPPIPTCKTLDQCEDCPFGTTCVDGICLPENCEITECDFGEKCVMTPIACFVAPCPTEVPMCIPIDYNCIETTCLEGTSCVEGECVPNTCDAVDCLPGEECIVEETQCDTPPCAQVSTCVSIIDPCSLLICAENTKCVDGKCVPFLPTCGDITCHVGEDCYFPTPNHDCSATKCHLVPICKPVDRCAKVHCRPNYMCMNGRCVRQTCNRYSCGPGEECYFLDDPCYAFRVPSCKPAQLP